MRSRRPDGRTVLQLHAWDKENHPNLVNRATAPPGHGVLLWFMVEDFEATVERARGPDTEVVEVAHINPAPCQWEIRLRDPDGYVVVIAGPAGGAAEPQSVYNNDSWDAKNQLIFYSRRA